MTFVDIERKTALWWLAAATALGAAFRFYNLGWGAPYFHFHIDEHFVFQPADLLRRDPHAAAMLPKFFMYSPLPMYLVNGVRSVYEAVAHPLVLTVPRDEVTYMVMGRAISAALGTATIPLVYYVAQRVAGRLAGVVAALLLACSVIHLRESHFFTVDISMTFFSVLTWCFLMRTVARGDALSDVGTSISFALGMLSKYTAIFLAPLIVFAQLLSAAAPRSVRPAARWIVPLARAAAIGAVALAIFFALDPLVIRYYPKFRSDLKDWVTDPLLGAWKPEWVAQFADVNPTTYWFTNLLWWSLGPAFECWALAGIVWLFVRRDRFALIVASFPVVLWLLVGRTIAPFIRYAVPLAPPLAVAAGALSADWMRRPRLRFAALVGTPLVVIATGLWAIAYMNVYRQPDARLAASKWIHQTIPAHARILVEPSHNIPPTGTYLTSIDFYGQYVLFYPRTEEHDYYDMYVLDTYRTLYNRGPSDEFRRDYIRSRLAMVDWIVMDEWFYDQYKHLPESEHGVVKQYYRDLFAGRLGFQLVKTFKAYPSLFGHAINDDNAEWTFRQFDHPRVYIFHRQ